MAGDAVDVGIVVLVGVLLDVAVGIADGDSVVVAVGVDVFEHTAYGGVQPVVLVVVAVGVGDMGLLGGGHFSSSALQ